MKDYKISKTYFNHLSFYYDPNFFSIFAVTIDKIGFVIGIGFWGLYWSWKNEN